MGIPCVFLRISSRAPVHNTYTVIRIRDARWSVTHMSTCNIEILQPDTLSKRNQSKGNEASHEKGLHSIWHYMKPMTVLHKGLMWYYMKQVENFITTECGLYKSQGGTMWILNVALSKCHSLYPGSYISYSCTLGAEPLICLITLIALDLQCVSCKYPEVFISVRRVPANLPV